MKRYVYAVLPLMFLMLIYWLCGYTFERSEQFAGFVFIGVVWGVGFFIATEHK